MGCGNHAEDYEVLVSESLDIAAEWRCFITYDEINNPSLTYQLSCHMGAGA